MRKNRKSGIITGVISALILVEVVLLTVILIKISGTKQYKEQLSLGDKYLQELDYENAELCYLAAIDIDEKNVTPYLGLSTIYARVGQFDDAYAILERAEKAVDKDDYQAIENQRQQVEKLQEQEEASDKEKSEQDQNPAPNPEGTPADKTTNDDQDGFVEPIYVQAGQTQEYKGNVYTVLPVNEDAGMFSVGSGYTTYLAVYRDHIYYTREMGTGGGPTDLIRTNLDGTDADVLVSDIESWEIFCIYDNELYYTASDWDGSGMANYYSKSLNLDTLAVQNHDYFFQYGSEDAWIVKKDINLSMLYCCYPGYKNIQDTPVYGVATDSGWLEEWILGVHGEYIYYNTDGADYRDSIYTLEDDRYYIQDDSPIFNSEYSTLEFHSWIIGDGLYYFEVEQMGNYLCRLDLNTMEKQRFDIMTHEYNWIWYWLCCAEANGKFYYTVSADDYDGQNAMLNTEYWELDLETGARRMVGAWFQS